MESHALFSFCTILPQSFSYDIKEGSDIKMKTNKLNIHPIKWFALVFAILIVVGAVLLLLPIASKDRHSCGLMTSIFTATSATCVTGLTLCDTYTQWSGFGQLIIICLIEIGGLGFMSFASLMLFSFKKKTGLKQRLAIAQALSVNDMREIVNLQKFMLTCSLLVQSIGAVLLMLRFVFYYNFSVWEAIKYGAFHSISAFCNAGFDIFGFIEPGTSLLHFQKDVFVLMVLGLIIMISSLGFFVWYELFTLKTWKKISVYSKLMLVATISLTVFGTVYFLIAENNNPKTFGDLSTGIKIVNSWFQTVSLRTAGFSTINQGNLTEGSKVISILYMFIGGGSGSTAGGAKLITIVVVLLFVTSQLRGYNDVNVFNRKIDIKQVMNAITIVMVMIGLITIGALILCETSDVTCIDSVYETVSAFSTVGNSTGIISDLSLFGKILLISYMYFGRVGILTLSISLLMGDKNKNKYSYAKTTLLIG